MPIYEFYCASCHAVFSFLSRSTGNRKRPACPDCGRARLPRKVSAFAISTGARSSAEESELPAGLDEARMERAMAQLAQQAEGVDESDPRGMARLMHDFYSGAGLSMGDGMTEALRRMEAGEDPDSIEKELGDVLQAEDPFVAGESQPLGRLRRRLRPPRVDSTLHEL